jgi:hypothetical protein
MSKLAVDIIGRGHRSMVIGPDECLLVWVPVPSVATDHGQGAHGSR